MRFKDIGEMDITDTNSWGLMAVIAAMVFLFVPAKIISVFVYIASAAFALYCIYRFLNKYVYFGDD